MKDQRLIPPHHLNHTVYNSSEIFEPILLLWYDTHPNCPKLGEGSRVLGRHHLNFLVFGIQNTDLFQNQILQFVSLK